MKSTRWPYVMIPALLLCISAALFLRKTNLNTTYVVGQPIDSLNSVIVYYNGGVGNVTGRNLAPDNYNLGLRYQCVEFVKRYYYEHLNHKMPDSYGHAKDFFDKDIQDGKLNKKRNLVQYNNPGSSRPLPNDLIIFDGHIGNRYGHVAIVSAVTGNEVEIIQQNPGPYGKSRAIFSLENRDSKWKIKGERVLGWLRK